MSADAEVHPAPGRQRLREMAEEVRTGLDPGNSRLAFGMSSINRLMPTLGPGPSAFCENKFGIGRHAAQAVSDQQMNRCSAPPIQ
jgi:hypothetical protein